MLSVESDRVLSPESSIVLCSPIVHCAYTVVALNPVHTHTQTPHTQRDKNRNNKHARARTTFWKFALSLLVYLTLPRIARGSSHASRQAAATRVRRRTRERRRARRRAAAAPPLDITPRLRRAAAARARGRAACAAAARRRAPSWRSCRPRRTARCSTRRPCASARGPG